MLAVSRAEQGISKILFCPVENKRKRAYTNPGKHGNQLKIKSKCPSADVLRCEGFKINRTLLCYATLRIDITGTYRFHKSTELGFFFSFSTAKAEHPRHVPFSESAELGLKQEATVINQRDSRMFVTGRTLR